MTGLPTLATGDVQLRWARPEVLDSARHRMLRLLTLAERLRYEATPRREARDSFLLGRVLVRELAAESLGADPLDIVIEARCAACGGPHGKPAVVGDAAASRLRVSIAHCDGAIVVALAVGREIGIDVERMRVLRERAEADPLRPLRIRAVRKADGRCVPEESVRFRDRAGAPEAWVDGSDTYYAISEPAVHSALMVSIALAHA